MESPEFASTIYELNIKNNVMDKCSLCKVKDADKTGSHIVPHFLLKLVDSVEGKTGRDVELGFVIEPFETISYFGRGVQQEKLDEVFGELSDEEIEVKKNRPLVVDNLFCSLCEKRMAVIESEYAKTLEKISEVEYNSGIVSEVGLLFWMSVIWRISILNKSGNRFKKGENEVIRRILNRTLTDSIKTIDYKNMQESKDVKKIAYKLMRCPNYAKDSASVMLFHPEFHKPYTLLIGEFILFLSINNHFDQYLTRDFFGLKDEVFLATTNMISTNESIFPISKEVMKYIHAGIIDQIKEIRLKNMDDFFNLLHVELGGVGDTMPFEIKNEILAEVTSDEKKSGRKYTIEDLRDSTFKVMKKYAP